MLDVFNNDAFSTTSLAAAVTKIQYIPTRLGPGGLNLFDERPIATTTVAIEARDESLALIADTPRGAPGDFIGEGKARLYSFIANHLKRIAKIFADEVQGVRVYGSENELLTIEAKRDEKLAILRRMHELTWEFHRVGALIGIMPDADGTTVLRNLFTEFGIVQQTVDFVLSGALDVRAKSEEVADMIDAELGGSTYERIHCFCGGAFYDALIGHEFVQEVLVAEGGARMLTDLRSGFTIGPITFERAKRWQVRTPAGATINMIHTDQAYAFPVGAVTSEGPMFIGRFAPPPFLDTVNRLNPPLVVKTVKDPADQFLDLIGVSCPLYLNTRPRAVIKLTKS